MACGCADNSCSCVITAGNGVTVSGSGTVDNPFVVSAIPGGSETAWTGSNTDGGIGITSGGTNGHSPILNLVLDPASPATLSVSEDGLSVACCDAEPATPAMRIIDEDTVLDDTDNFVLVDTVAGAITVTLPAVPAAGQEIHIIDYGNSGMGNATANPITIDFNGMNLYGTPGSASISADGASTKVLFDGVDNYIGGYA